MAENPIHERNTKMKKIIALALCLIMVLSLGIVASAATVDPATVVTVDAAYKPEGTGIDSLDKITDMAGKYYLTADVTATAMIETDFTGVLDGNGHTITVSAPLFKTVKDATIMNVIFNGAITYAEDAPKAGSFNHAATVALEAEGKSTFKNILSNVSISAAGTKSYVSGIVGTANTKDAEILIDTCVNTGALSAPEGKGAAGIYGWSAKTFSLTIKNCVNTGAITAKNDAGGILVRPGQPLNSSFLIENCANTGAITSEKSYAGGIYANSSTPGQVLNCVNTGAISGGKNSGGIAGTHPEGGASGVYVFRNCLNTGAVTTTSGHSGGIIGYIWASGQKIYGDIQGCHNTATITGTGFTSQIIAYTNSDYTIIRNNLGTGKVTGEGADVHFAFVGGSSAALATYDIKNNYLIENDGITHYTYTASDGKEANIITIDKRVEGSIIIVTAAQLASGEVAFALNEGLQANVFTQTLGTDAVPTIQDGGKFVIKTADGKYENSDTGVAYSTTEVTTEAPTEATTEAQTTERQTRPMGTTTTPTPTSAPDATEAPTTEAPSSGGCGSVIGTGAAVAVAALALTFIAFKKKED